MSFICIRIRNHYQINCVALSLALKQRFEATLPIYYLLFNNCSSQKAYLTRFKDSDFFLYPAHLLCFVTCDVTEFTFLGSHV